MTTKREKPIYLDHQATTPCDPVVMEAMLPYFTERFGNASSRVHAYGLEADAGVETARASIARAIGASSEREIVFTAGATEANNLALDGTVAAAGPSRRHLVISGIEHEAVMEPAIRLRDKGGCSLTIVPPGRDGLVDPDEVEAAIQEDTLLVSVMHANNVIGTVNDIGAMGAACRSRGVLFHTDAAQSLGKVPFDVSGMAIDLASVSGHKLYAPKGVGFLYRARRPSRPRLEPIMLGGGQEDGLRPGTTAVPLVVGLGRAVGVACDVMEGESARLLRRRDRLLSIIRQGLDGIIVNGALDPGKRLPGNLNLSFEGVDGEALLVGLRHRVAASSGSACASGSTTPSRVLLAIGRAPREAAAALRLGLGRFTTDEEIEVAGQAVIEAVRKIRV